MKILCVFLDMIRPNRLATFNPKRRDATPLDEAFYKIGGTYYTNCFTPGPDTPRSLSSFYTGIDCFENGCNTRLKWPRFFLRNDLETIFDLFLKQGYKLDLFSALTEREAGFYPQHIHDMNIHNSNTDLGDYLSGIELEDNHFIFLSIPDYHWAFDDYGYSTYGEKKAYIEVKKSLDIVFRKFNKDDFDHIFIFSDHGFKFAAEMKIQPICYLLNEDRTNILMLHRTKAQTSLSKNDKLFSISDCYSTFAELLSPSGSQDNQSQLSLLGPEGRAFVISEDHANFMPELNQNIEIWSLTNHKHVYLREIDKATLINRESGTITHQTMPEYDEILSSNSSFGRYHDEYEKIFLYQKNILDRSVYINGSKREKTSKYLDMLNKIKDIPITNSIVNWKK